MKNVFFEMPRSIGKTAITRAFADCIHANAQDVYAECKAIAERGWGGVCSNVAYEIQQAADRARGNYEIKK